MSEQQKPVVKKEKKEKTYKTYNVDFSQPVEATLLSLEAAKKYLENNIKVKGLKNKLGDFIKVNVGEKQTKNKNSIAVQVDSTMKFSKRYIRYLTKKFLKREGINRYLVVSSTSRTNYAVKMIKKNEA